SISVFFFQAEDGIRDLTVTGVQTCALPISERANQPDRLARNEPLDIVAADQGDVVAELLTVQLDQSMSMPVFFRAHFVQDSGRPGIVRLEAVREVVIDARVLLFQ